MCTFPLTDIISLSVKLPSYLFCNSLVSNIQLMIDCGILSTVQVIVVVSLSLTSLSLEILEMVGWSTSSDKFKSICLRPLWLIMNHQKTIKFYFLFLVLVVILNVHNVHNVPLRASSTNFDLIWFSAFSGEDLNVIFMKICLIGIIGINQLKEKCHRKPWNIC